jgi:serine/threonine protein phosphatase PrpC
MDAILRGADHPDLDVIETRSVAPDLAIALTRGRLPKRYAHTDLNEDVVAVRRDDDRTALVVADGHRGHEASHVAVDAVLRLVGRPVHPWSRHDAVRALHAVNEQIHLARAALSGEHRGTRTTLVVGVVAVDDDGQRYLTHSSVGDSAVLVLRGQVVHRISRDRHHFLGDAMSAPLVAGAMDYGQTDLEDDDVVIVVSDGYTNFAPVEAIASAWDPAPDIMVRRIVEIAGDGGAGDNVAAAVLGPVRSPDRS